MVKAHESKLRSVIKSISWRFVATATTILLVYIFTGKLIIALEVGGIELAAKFAIFYAHERVWDRIAWGKITSESE